MVSLIVDTFLKNTCFKISSKNIIPKYGKGYLHSLMFCCEYCMKETGETLQSYFYLIRSVILHIRQMITYKVKTGQLNMGKELAHLGKQEKTFSCPLSYSLASSKD